MALFGKKEPSLREKKESMGLAGEREDARPAPSAAPPRSQGAPPAAQTAAESGGPSQARQVGAQQAYCRICKDYRAFSRVWVRTAQLTECPTCGHAFQNPEALYNRDLPACPKCGEYLEHPQFRYGLCDGCGSKYELMEGTVPSLLPNRKQRAEMEKFGKSWSKG